MSQTIDGPRRDARSGEATRLVALLHGYGADGDDLFGLAEPLSQILPDAAFVAPNAPQPCAGNPMGYQWFPIPWLDGSSQDEAEKGFLAAAGLLNQFLDAELARLGLAGDDLALVGFSQGTMMSLEVAPRRDPGPACVVGFSGRLLASERLEQDAVSKPPILLVHGDADEMVPVASLDEARQALSAAGFSVRWRVCRGLGHGISQEGLELAAGFLVEALSGSGH